MRPPPTWKLKPSSHRITRIAKIVQSIKVSLWLVCLGWRVRLSNQDRFVLTFTEVDFEVTGTVLDDKSN